MLAVAFIAALSQLCYESTVYALQYGSGSVPLSMMLYGAISYCCAFSFFSNRWMSTMLNQIMLKNIIIWIALILLTNIILGHGIAADEERHYSAKSSDVKENIR